MPKFVSKICNIIPYMPVKQCMNKLCLEKKFCQVQPMCMNSIKQRNKNMMFMIRNRTKSDKLITGKIEKNDLLK